MRHGGGWACYPRAAAARRMCAHLVGVGAAWWGVRLHRAPSGLCQGEVQASARARAAAAHKTCVPEAVMRVCGARRIREVNTPAGSGCGARDVSHLAPVQSRARHGPPGPLGSSTDRVFSATGRLAPANALTPASRCDRQCRAGASPFVALVTDVCVSCGPQQVNPHALAYEAHLSQDYQVDVHVEQARRVG